MILHDAVSPVPEHTRGLFCPSGRMPVTAASGQNLGLLALRVAVPPRPPHNEPLRTVRSLSVRIGLTSLVGGSASIARAVMVTVTPIGRRSPDRWPSRTLLASTGVIILP
jgi:hypothetical protein